jgi:hypothetical protein
MTKIFEFLALALLLVFAVVTVAQTKKRSGRSVDSKEQVLDVYRRIVEANLRNDTEELDRTMADDFVAIGTHGEVTGDKRSLLSLMKAGRIKITYHKDRMLRVTIGRARAVVTGESTTRGQHDGQVFNMRYQFSDVFIRRGGQWQNALSRLTRIIPN